MMKAVFEIPTLEIILFKANDVITTSVNDEIGLPGFGNGGNGEGFEPID